MSSPTTPAAAGENAFIKERQAVKEHAAESTGEEPNWMPREDTAVEDEHWTWTLANGCGLRSALEEDLPLV